MSPQEQLRLTNVFLTDFYALMKRANFNVLVPEEFDCFKNHGFLLDVPSKVDESKMDSSFLTEFLDEHPTISSRAKTFGNRVLVFHRGHGVVQKHGRFLSEKLDLLQEFLIGRPVKKVAGKIRRQSDEPGDCTQAYENHRCLRRPISLSEQNPATSPMSPTNLPPRA